MAEQARVQSIEALVRFRAALAEFGEGVGHALGGVEIELRRGRDWLEHEMPRYWKGQIKLWDQRMVEARSALHRKNLQRTDGFVPDVSQEKEMLRVCKARIEQAERKLAAIKRWLPQFQHAMAEYQANTRALADASTIDLERMLAMLDRMIEALEAYVGTSPPRDVSGMPGSGAEAAEPPAPRDDSP